MSQYYYVVSSLPMLLLESDRFPAEQEFLDQCAAWLTSADYDLLSRASLHPAFTRADEQSVLGRWYAAEKALRNELVRMRAARLHVDEDKYLSGDGPPVWLSTGELEAKASEAFNQDSPLRAEQALDEYRWMVLDELEIGHYFDIEKLILYYLKLQILQRKAAMERDRGKSLFDTTYNAIIDRYYSTDENQQVESQA